MSWLKFHKEWEKRKRKEKAKKGQWLVSKGKNKTLKTHEIGSLFEGNDYIGVFSNKTGELIKHYRKFFDMFETEEPKQGPAPKEEINKDQLNMFD